MFRPIPRIPSQINHPDPELKYALGGLAYGVFGAWAFYTCLDTKNRMSIVREAAEFGSATIEGAGGKNLLVTFVPKK